MGMTHTWRPDFFDSEVNSQHAQAFGSPVTKQPWWNKVNRHSLGWVCTRDIQ